MFPQASKTLTVMKTLSKLQDHRQTALRKTFQHKIIILKNKETQENVEEEGNLKKKKIKNRLTTIRRYEIIFFSPHTLIKNQSNKHP